MTMPNQSGRDRGSHGGQRTNKHKNTKPEKKTIKNIEFAIGSAKKASEYVTNLEIIINKARMTYKQGEAVAQALEGMEPYDWSTHEPTMGTPVETDADKKKVKLRRLQSTFRSSMLALMPR